MSLKRSFDIEDSSISSGKLRRAALDTLEPQVNLLGPFGFKEFLKGAQAQTPDISPEHLQDDEATGTNNVELAPISSQWGAEDCICFGMIHGANTKLLDMDATFSKLDLDVNSSFSGFTKVQLSLQGDSFLIGNHSNEKIAVMNEEITKILHKLSTLESCRFEGYLSSDTLGDLTNKGSNAEKSAYLPVDIVIYGSKTIQNSVGKILSSEKIYLQHPCYQDPTSEYSNPHVLDVKRILSTAESLTPSRFPTDIPLDTGTKKVDMHTSEAEEEQVKSITVQTQLQNNFNKVLGSLTRFKSLKKLEADTKVLTPLLSHQKEALDFMSQREFGPIPTEYSLWMVKHKGAQTWYEHAITGARIEEPPPETQGGILADDMGLGKTLTVLSTIIRTAEAARTFADGQHHVNILPTTEFKPQLNPSKATLVVVSSPLLIEGWEKEIDLHCAGALGIYVYHGRGRVGDYKILADWDIVVSTYHTIAAEALDPQSPLFQIDWFRIVLDEAHIIRRMSTKLFQAVTMLSAQFRWCLTGTPVQNSLEDFAALLTFIHTSQLDSLPEFRKHIIMPLTRDTDQSINSFRLLLDSVCLRRTNKLLRLPQIVENYHYIELSSTEKNLYDKIQAERILAIKRQHNQSKATKDNLDFFQLELRLRLVCNHGTFQNYLSESALERLQFDAEQAFQSLRKQQLAKCKKCNLVVEGLDELKDRPGVFTVCGHLLCSECVGPYSMSVENDDHLQRKCLFCNRQLPKTFILTSPTISSPFFTKQSTFAKSRESGATSSKVSALIHHIKTNEMPGKRIIFSCWTSSLDLIENHLVSERIKFSRIDGNYSIPQRQQILEDFDQESEVQILLMTTGTGAVGLNLTIANCVYILEPQWNPMVERQAIGRVLRIGQTRNVRVIRYIVEGTVEKKLKDQQGRKLGYAKLGWRQRE